MEETALADRLEEQVAGVCLILAPLLMVPNTFFEYREGMLFWAGYLGVLAYTCLVPGLLGIARLLRRRAPRLSVIGGLLATVGAVFGAVFSAAILFDWAERAAGTPAATLVAINGAVEGRLFPALIPFGVLFPVSLLLLGVGLFRTGAAPKWVGALLGVGAILFPVGHVGESQFVSHLAELLLLVPMVWIGLRSLTHGEPAPVALPATT